MIDNNYHVLGHAEQGNPLYLLVDWNIDDIEREILRDWQPPPPLRG